MSDSDLPALFPREFSSNDKDPAATFRTELEAAKVKPSLIDWIYQAVESVQRSRRPGDTIIVEGPVRAGPYSGGMLLVRKSGGYDYSTIVPRPAETLSL